ncbi:hypothetical protein FOL47_003006 [Perkinsus chesapeaki]|uniref:Uncharacterized protein n=1 Tax=Perkinsus chesapeaki TaxID=330153 RepID=A0A7J6N0L6_PERCH|nr:hypothetical protein FOL47_003006 [Perkinsus chesapeaki]
MTTPLEKPVEVIESSGEETDEFSDEIEDLPSAERIVSASEKLRMIASKEPPESDKAISSELLRSALLDQIGRGTIHGDATPNNLLADDPERVLGLLVTADPRRIRTHTELLCQRLGLGRPHVHVNKQSLTAAAKNATTDPDASIMSIDFGNHPFFMRHESWSGPTGRTCRIARRNTDFE